MRIITLTTDFGLEDWFVGTMKGVILSINPSATIADISHGIQAGDIRAGAFALAASYRLFPKGTVHLAVVDPGVGSKRKMIAVRTKNYFFVGPDNGLLSWALARESVQAVHRLENKRFFLPNVSTTFHGRDIFAPVAAHLSKGVPIGKLGPPVSNYKALPPREPTRRGGQIVGEIIYIDRFGNAITNIGHACLSQECSTCRQFKVVIGNRILPLADFYEAVPKGKPVAVVGSTGHLEIAINGGSAAERLALEVGGVVTILHES